MPSDAVAHLPDDALHILAHAAAQQPNSAEHAFTDMEPDVVTRMPNDSLVVLTQGTARDAHEAADTFVSMPPRTVMCVPDKDARAVAYALRAMPSATIARLPKDALIVPAQAAAKDAYAASAALRGMRTDSVVHLPDDALIALARGTVRNPSEAASAPIGMPLKRLRVRRMMRWTPWRAPRRRMRTRRR